MEDKFYITTPIYYASGKPHIGHAFTTLYADVVARYQKLQGKDVFFATGMDEHGSKIFQAAQKQGKEPQEFVDEIAEDYKDLWKKLGIEYSGFIRTTSPRHQKGVYKFLELLKKSGAIYAGEYEGLYCVGCENFILERNLVNGVCPDHLTPPQKIKEKNYFFNLKKYLPSLKGEIEKDNLKIVPETRKNEILKIIERERVKWGIPFPFEKNQTVYVWVEALMNYVTILGFPEGENFKRFWPADVHIIGAEINKFHSIFWPALLMAVNLPLPRKIFVHGLFTVNGQKMSKTLGNVIDPLDMIEKFGVDGTRYLLLSQFSAAFHGDIKEAEFTTKYNSDLANGVGNLAERILSMIIKFKKGVLEISNDIDKEIEDVIGKAKTDYHKNMEDLALFEALQDAFSLIKKIDKYIDEKKPWELHKKENTQELDKTLKSAFLALEQISHFLLPFMPFKMKELRILLSEIKNKELKKEIKLNLFPRIMD